jgi:Leucine-rich repeat (LRR) protein
MQIDLPTIVTSFDNIAFTREQKDIKDVRELRETLMSPPESTISSKNSSFCKKCHVCSFCQSKILNQIYSFCETCANELYELYVLCEECIDKNTGHDITHKFALCSSENKILRKSRTPSVSIDVISSDNLSSPRHAFLKKHESKSSLKLSCSIYSSDETTEMSEGKILNDVSELEFEYLDKEYDKEYDKEDKEDKEDNKEKKQDFDFYKQSKNKRRNFCCGKMSALKNAREIFSISEIIERCVNDTNEVSLNLEEVMQNRFDFTLVQYINNNMFSHIKILNLQKNNLSNLDSCIFRLIHVFELNLENNILTKIPEDIKNMTNLSILKIGSNKLVDLPYGLSKLYNLKKIYADFNNFRQFPPVITEINKLNLLSLEYNPEITTFPPSEKMEHFVDLTIYIDNSPELINDWNKNYNDMYNIIIEWNFTFPDKILDNLFLGGIKSTFNDYVFQYYNIDTVLTVARNLDIFIIDNVNYEEYNIDDIIGAKINFTILEKIHQFLTNGRICLVHCFAGISRSPTVIIAYIMKYHNMNLNSAFNFVKSKRNKIVPNDGFWEQLVEYEKVLYPDPTIGD